MIGIVVLGACKDTSSDKWELVISKELKMMGHKGSGTMNENGNLGLFDNSWSSIKNAIDYTDGSEVDIQMSKDSTLWLFHDHELVDCIDSLRNFFHRTDKQIRIASVCSYSNQLVKLRDFIDLAQEQNWKGKVLSLDLKALYNPETVAHFGGDEKLAEFVAKELTQLLKEVEMEVLLEVKNEQQVKIFREILPFKTFMVNYNPTQELSDKSAKESIPLSLPIYNLPKNFTVDSKNGLQLWTINDADDFFHALRYKPSHLQSDNVPMMRFFKRVQQGEQLHLIASYPISIGDDGLVSDFYPLVDEKLGKFPELFRFVFDKTKFPKETILVVSVTNAEGENVYWKGTDLTKNATPYFFIDHEFFKANRGETIQIHIWNKGMSPLKFKGKVEKYRL